MVQILSFGLARKVGATNGASPNRQALRDATYLDQRSLLRQRIDPEIPMRTLLVLVGIAALVILAGMVTGFINIDQTQTAQLPRIEGGQAPEFKADVGKIDLGTERKVIEVPKVEVERPGAEPTPTQ
ncbi:hypothetical protein [Sphingomonas jeddahensis]|nr:hypothetical protein [Sphingomonas jeddahensis]